MARVLQRNLGALVRMLQYIPLLGTVVSPVVQKFPLTSRPFCLWWHVSGTVGYSLKSWLSMMLSTYHTTVLNKRARYQKCV